MTKIFTLTELQKLAQKYKKNGKKVGLVVGSFDVCHLGHLNLFRLAKDYVDILFVGLDHDEIIRKTKGPSRPINNFERRAKFLSDLTTIDGVFLIENTSEYNSEEAQSSYEALLKQILPSHIFTHKTCDKHWEAKANLAKKLNIQLILDESKKITTSGTIIKLLESEF